LIKPVLYIVVFICFNLSGQVNLVPNGSFEDFSVCPEIDGPLEGEINKAIPWYDPPTGTGDLLNICSNNAPNFPGHCGVPDNYWGNQYPFDGDGYAGIAGISNQSTPTEHIAVRLLSPLEKGICYSFSMRANLSGDYNIEHNGLGVLFSSDSIIFDSNYHPEFIEPSISFEDIVSDTNEWQLISGNYVADGTEQFLCLGVFQQPSQVINEENKTLSYIFIDSVMLVASSSSCNHLNEINVLTPNNDGINDIWNLENTFDANLFITNRWGNTLFSALDCQPCIWKPEDFSDGVYFYKIEFEGNVKTGFIHLIK
jgi:gliding motility-associated-like protein